VEGSCDCGNEPLGSIKCCEVLSGCTKSSRLSSAEFRKVSVFRMSIASVIVPYV
jgi:hypothetical protein